jgi:hypothetical protein
MATKHDHELEQFQRTIDLVAYAMNAGYDVRPDVVGRGLAVLEHPNRDRIVVAQRPDGRWIYASVPDYQRGSPSESERQALTRLRACIERSDDKGSIVEFVQSREGTPRARDVPIDRVRQRLREFRATGPLDVEDALRSTARATGRERSPDASHASSQVDARGLSDDEGNPRTGLGLNRRRYDWTPPPVVGAREVEVEERLRRWREADATVERRLPSASRAQGGDSRSAPALAPARAAGSSVEVAGPASNAQSVRVGRDSRSDLGRRRYDWTPAPADRDAIVRGSRRLFPDRER